MAKDLIRKRAKAGKPIRLIMSRWAVLPSKPERGNLKLSRKVVVITGAARVDGFIPAEALADCVVEGVEAERFLIFPHPSVLTYFRRKAADYDRRVAGMRRFEERLRAG